MRAGGALANTHTWPSLVGMTPEQRVRAEDPLVAVGVEVGPVAVGHRAGVPARPRRGGADTAAATVERIAVGADHERRGELDGAPSAVRGPHADDAVRRCEIRSVTEVRS